MKISSSGKKNGNLGSATESLSRGVGKIQNSSHNSTVARPCHLQAVDEANKTVVSKEAILKRQAESKKAVEEALSEFSSVDTAADVVKLTMPKPRVRRTNSDFEKFIKADQQRQLLKTDVGVLQGTFNMLRKQLAEIQESLKRLEESVQTSPSLQRKHELVALNMNDLEHDKSVLHLGSDTRLQAVQNDIAGMRRKFKQEVKKKVVERDRVHKQFKKKQQQLEKVERLVADSNPLGLKAYLEHDVEYLRESYQYHHRLCTVLEELIQKQSDLDVLRREELVKSSIGFAGWWYSKKNVQSLDERNDLTAKMGALEQVVEQLKEKLPQHLVSDDSNIEMLEQVLNESRQKAEGLILEINDRLKLLARVKES